MTIKCKCGNKMKVKGIDKTFPKTFIFECKVCKGVKRLTDKQVKSLLGVMN